MGHWRAGCLDRKWTGGPAVWVDIIGQRWVTSCHGSNQSEGLLMQRGVKVSKEEAKRAAFVLSLSRLLSAPCGGDAAWGQSQPLLATIATGGPKGLAGAGEAKCVIPCSCLCLPMWNSGHGVGFPV